MKHVVAAVAGLVLLSGCATSGTPRTFDGGSAYDACLGEDSEACWSFAQSRAATSAEKRDAFVAYQFACTLDHAPSCRELGRLLGEGAPRDEAQGDALLESACEAGDLEACVAHAGGLSSRRAAPLYRRACDEGMAEGCAGLARVLAGQWRLGDRLIEAHELNLKACELGSNAGCAAAGQALVFGSGIPKDPEAGVRLLEQACTPSNGEGCLVLAKIFEEGMGVPADLARASTYYDRVQAHQPEPTPTRADVFVIDVDACNRGNALGCFAAAEMLHEGADVTRNITTARAFYGMACDAGITRGCERAQQIRGARRS